jgi:hypothetical protein
MIKKYLLLGLLATVVPAAANTFFISMDTSTISGVTGSLFFSYGPGLAPVDSATATISGFSGGTLGSVIFPGGTGVLPATLTMDNSAPVNYQQAITFGNKISFFVALTGPAVSNPSAGAIGGTDLALFLLDGSDGPLPIDDPDGLVLDVSIAPNTGQISVTGQPVVTSVLLPEPGSMLLLLSGMVLVGSRLRRR